MEFPEAIDLVAYINLEKRRDRKAEIEREFARLRIPGEKILRWSATRTSDGALGCTLSHIALLEHILTLPPESMKTVLILEDDFDFIGDATLVKESLAKLLDETQYPRDTWDIALLAFVVAESKPRDSLISTAFFSQGTAGYLVNRDGIPRLLANFKEGKELLEKTRRKINYSLDIYWWKFMQSGKCVFFNTPLGLQRKSYSNITGKIKASESYVRETPELMTYKGLK